MNLPDLQMDDLIGIYRSTLEQAPESPDPAAMAQAILFLLDRVETLEREQNDSYRHRTRRRRRSCRG